MKSVFAFAVVSALMAAIGLGGYRSGQVDPTAGNSENSLRQSSFYNITFERTACYGRCPDFVLMIDYRGNVRLQVTAIRRSSSDTSEFGHVVFSTKLSSEHHARLSKRFDTGGFRKLKLDYSAAVTDGPSTTISIDSPEKHWATQVYMVPCASDAARRDADMLNRRGITEFVPDIFCELSDKLDEIACDTYLHGSRLGSDHDLVPFSPPQCRRSR